MTGITKELSSQARKDQRAKLVERKEAFEVGAQDLSDSALVVIKRWGNPEGFGVCAVMAQRLGVAARRVVDTCIVGPPRAPYLRNIGAGVCKKCPLYETCDSRVEPKEKERRSQNNTSR